MSLGQNTLDEQHSEILVFFSHFISVHNAGWVICKHFGCR